MLAPPAHRCEFSLPRTRCRCCTPNHWSPMERRSWMTAIGADRDGIVLRSSGAPRSRSVAVEDKRDALASEASVLARARRGDSVVVESECFGPGNAAYVAVRDAAQRGVRVRLLVNGARYRRDLSERTLLRDLSAAGVEVGLSASCEKFALVNGTAAWIGSANATIEPAANAQEEWSLQTHDPAVCARLSNNFEHRWHTARLRQARPSAGSPFDGLRVTRSPSVILSLSKGRWMPGCGG